MSVESNKSLKYQKTILSGVEVKRFLNTEQSYKNHLHKELSIGYIINGCSNVEFSQQKYRFSEGDGVVIPPKTSHLCCPEDINNWQVVMLYIDPAYYNNSLSFNKAAKLSPASLNLLLEFISLLESDADIDTLDSALSELLIETANSESECNTAASRSELASVKDYIDKNYKQNICLSELNQVFKINKFTLIRQFKKTYNTTPSAYQLQLKIAEAKKMLSDGADVFDICLDIGFYDQSHFIREFKKMNGVTPASYLKDSV